MSSAWDISGSISNAENKTLGPSSGVGTVIFGNKVFGDGNMFSTDLATKVDASGNSADGSADAVAANRSPGSVMGTGAQDSGALRAATNAATAIANWPASTWMLAGGCLLAVLVFAWGLFSRGPRKKTEKRR